MLSNVLLQFAVLVIFVQSYVCVTIVPRNAWGAAAPKWTTRVRRPVQYVIIHHTENPSGCSAPGRCQQLIRNIQSYHKGRRNFSDIGYNFIVAGDGNVYEGRGFGLQGAHATQYNSNSIGISFLGNFENELPSADMMNNAKDVIAQAISSGYLKRDYTLLGHKQTKSTTCPGTALYNEIRTWPKWKLV